MLSHVLHFFPNYKKIGFLFLKFYSTAYESYIFFLIKISCFFFTQPLQNILWAALNTNLISASFFSSRKIFKLELFCIFLFYSLIVNCHWILSMFLKSSHKRLTPNLVVFCKSYQIYDKIMWLLFAFGIHKGMSHSTCRHNFDAIKFNNLKIHYFCMPVTRNTKRSYTWHTNPL